MILRTQGAARQGAKPSEPQHLWIQCTTGLLTNVKAGKVVPQLSQLLSMPL